MSSERLQTVFLLLCHRVSTLYLKPSTAEQMVLENSLVWGQDPLPILTGTLVGDQPAHITPCVLQVTSTF